MKKTAIIMSVLCLAAVCARAQVVISDSDKARAAELVKQMTLDEKIDYIAGARSFFTHAIPRLGIPEVWHTDGPHGIRPEVLWDKWNQAGWTNDSSTAFPALSALAAFCGFSGYQALQKAFRSRTGLTMSAWRKRHFE